MGESLDLGRRGRRLESVQIEVHDTLRCVISLGARFNGLETRLGLVENRMTTLEGRFDHLAERMGKLEEQNAMALCILRKFADAQGSEVP